MLKRKRYSFFRFLIIFLSNKFVLKSSRSSYSLLLLRAEVQVWIAPTPITVPIQADQMYQETLGNYTGEQSSCSLMDLEPSAMSQKITWVCLLTTRVSTGSQPGPEWPFNNNRETCQSHQQQGTCSRAGGPVAQAQILQTSLTLHYQPIRKPFCLGLYFCFHSGSY